MSKTLNTANLSQFKMEVAPRDLSIRDIYGNEIGLIFTVVPDTHEQYQDAQERVRQKTIASKQRGRGLKASDQREMEQDLMIARILDLKVVEPFKTQVGEPAFNKASVKHLLYGLDEFSAVIRKQIDDVLREMAEGFEAE